MKKKSHQRDWTGAQPHDAKTGKFKSRKFANAHPERVEWVAVKKKRSK